MENQIQFIYEENPPQFYYNFDNTKLIETKTKREAGIVGYFDDNGKNKLNALGSIYYFVPNQTLEMNNIYVVAYDDYLYLVSTEEICKTYTFKILMAYFAQEELTMCMYAANDLKVLFCVFPDDDALVEYNYANNMELQEKVKTYVHIDLVKNILYDVYPNEEKYKAELTEGYAEDYVKTKLLKVDELIDSSVIDSIINSSQQVSNSTMIKVPDFTTVTVDSSDDADEDIDDEDDENSVWSDEEDNDDEYDEDIDDEVEEDESFDDYEDDTEEDESSRNVKFLLEGRNIDSLINMYSEAFPIIKDLGTLYKNPKFSVVQRSIVLIFAVQLICSNKLFKLNSIEVQKYFEKYTNRVRSAFEGILDLENDEKAELDSYYTAVMNGSDISSQPSEQLLLFINILTTRAVNFSCTLIYYVKVLFNVTLPFNSSLLYGMINGDNNVMGMSYVVYSLIVSKLSAMGNNEEWNIDKILKYLDVKHLEDAHPQENYVYPYGYNNSAGIIDTMLIANAALRSIDDVDEHRYISDVYNMVGGLNEVAETCDSRLYSRCYRNNGADISKVLKKEKEGSYKKSLNIVGHYLRGLIGVDPNLNLMYLDTNLYSRARHRWLIYLQDFATPSVTKQDWFSYQSEWSKIAPEYPYVFTKTTFDNSLFRQMVWLYQNYNLHPFLSVINYTDNAVEIPLAYRNKANNVKEAGIADGEEAFIADLQTVADFIFTFIVGWKYIPMLKDLYEGQERNSVYMFGCTPWESMLTYINQACVKNSKFDYVMLDNITTQFVLVYTKLLNFYKLLWNKTIVVGSTLEDVLKLFDSLLRCINIIRIRNKTENIDLDYKYLSSTSISGDNSVKLLATSEYIEYSKILLDLLDQLVTMATPVMMKKYLDDIIRQDFLELTEEIAFLNNKFSKKYSFDIDDEITLYKELYKKYNFNYSSYLLALNDLFNSTDMNKAITLDSGQICGSLTLNVLLTMLKFDTYMDYVPYGYLNHLQSAYSEYAQAVNDKKGYFLGKISSYWGGYRKMDSDALVDSFEHVLVKTSFYGDVRLNFRNHVTNVFYLRLNAIIYSSLNNLQDKTRIGTVVDKVSNYIDWVDFILSDLVNRFIEMPILKYQNKLSLYGNNRVGGNSREYMTNIFDVGMMFIMSGLWLSKDDTIIYNMYLNLSKLYFDIYSAFASVAGIWANESDGYVLFGVKRNDLDKAVSDVMKIAVKTNRDVTKNSFYWSNIGYDSNEKVNSSVVRDLTARNILSDKDYKKYVESDDYILIELKQLAELFIASGANIVTLLTPDILYAKKVNDVFCIFSRDYNLNNYQDIMDNDLIVRGLAYDEAGCLIMMKRCESVLNFVLQTLNNNHIETNNNKVMKNLLQQYFEN